MNLHEQECKHSRGFTLVFTLHRWICNEVCGYHMNFNPELFPNGVAYIEKEGGKVITLNQDIPLKRKQQEE